MHTSNKQHLSLKFITNRSYVIWGVIALIMSICFAIIAIIGNDTHTKTDSYSWVILVSALIFCGIKL